MKLAILVISCCFLIICCGGKKGIKCFKIVGGLFDLRGQTNYK